MEGESTIKIEKKNINASPLQLNWEFFNKKVFEKKEFTRKKYTKENWIIRK